MEDEDSFKSFSDMIYAILSPESGFSDEATHSICKKTISIVKDKKFQSSRDEGIMQMLVNCVNYVPEQLRNIRPDEDQTDLQTDLQTGCLTKFGNYDYLHRRQIHGPRGGFNVSARPRAARIKIEVSENCDLSADDTTNMGRSDTVRRFLDGIPTA